LESTEAFHRIRGDIKRLNENGISNIDLENCYLESGNLRGADLEGVGHLTVEQLSKVKTLYKVRLDSELKEQIKKDYPHLLERS